MAASKGKKGKTKKGSPSRKSRLWLRDLLNILGGLLAGSVGFWIVHGYLVSRTAKGLSLRYENVIKGDLPALESASERYAYLAEQPVDPSEALEALDVNGSLCSLDAYRGIQDDFARLHGSARPLLLSFYLSLRDAELLRKLIVEQREHPEQMPRVLAREFVRTVQEGAQLAPRLLWVLGRGKETEDSP